MSFELDGKTNPPGTMYLGLIDALIDLFKEKGISDVEVTFISYKLDDKGEIVTEAGKDVAEIRPIAIGGLSSEIRDELKKEYDSTGHLISLIVFWRDPTVPAPGLGVLNLGRPTRSPFRVDDLTPLEKQAFVDYLNRLVKPKNT
ncbi:MAG: hypothetical protein ACREQ5_08045 [Candidatus Dormibacteria bacterium]